MKKIIIAIIVLVSICVLGILIAWSSGAFEHNNEDGLAIENFIDKNPENASFDSFIENMYSYEEFCIQYPMMSGGYYMYTAGRSNWSFASLNESFPIEYVRQIDSENILVIYKFKDADDQIFYMYIFMHKKESASSSIKNWQPNGRCFYSSKKLSLSDFNVIQANSSKEDVKKIDSSLNYGFGVDGEQYYSYHLLTDGILRINYTKDESGNFMVKETEYSIDYRVKEDKDWIGNKERICYVLPHELSSQ